MALLSAHSEKTREAAALALYHLGMASPAFCSETFDRLCVAMLHARGEAAVLAALDLLYTGGAPEHLAATYLTHVRPGACVLLTGSIRLLAVLRTTALQLGGPASYHEAQMACRSRAPLNTAQNKA